MSKIKNNLFCKYIAGHKTDVDFNDSGYLICKRCGAHEYYDYPMFNSLPLIYIPRYLFRKLIKLFMNLKEKFNKKDDKPF